LLALLDSPLNKAGMLQIFIKTDNNLMIEINPQIRIPRTYKRFKGLMAQLLTKLKIRGEHFQEFLMKVIKNDLTKILPIGCKKVSLTTQAKKVDLQEYINKQKDETMVFAIGAVSQGHPTDCLDYIDYSICISKFSLSAATCCYKLTQCFENKWKIDEIDEKNIKEDEEENKE